MRVFVMGGTGLVGTPLVGRLAGRGDEVVLLTRRPQAAVGRFPNCTVIGGDPTQAGAWADSASECDAVLNLVGEPIFGRRWNAEYKSLLRESRIRSTENAARIVERGGRAGVLVNASAIGFYGPRGDEELTEEGTPGDDFLARLTVDWERAASPAAAAGGRVVLVRIGVVLDARGGGLAQMLTPFKLGLGGPVGSGRQWLSWIHHDDIVGILLLALDNPQAAGPVNGTAPHPVTNREFAKALGRALRRPAFLPTPTFALRLKFGEVADVITTGQRVLPAKAAALRYQFRFPLVDGALADVLARP